VTESQATTQLLKALKEHGWFYKAADRYTAGVPDIIGLCDGRFCGIEMKIDSNRPTALQVFTLKAIDRNGGFTGIVTYSNKRKDWMFEGETYQFKDLVCVLFDCIYED
jgi:Holliday junction resolvase